MSKYNYHSLALTAAEEEEFKKTGLGVKKIFMAMVRGLNTPPEAGGTPVGQPQPVMEEE